MAITTNGSKIYWESSLLCQVMVPLYHSTKTAMSLSQLQQNQPRVHYTEAAGRVTCLVADAATVYLVYVKNTPLENIPTSLPLLAVTSSIMAEVTSKKALSPERILVLSFRIREVYLKLAGMAPSTPSPLLIGFMFQLGLEMTGKIFPVQGDRLPCAPLRVAIRRAFADRLREKPKTKRFCYTVIPDNLGYAAIAVAAYLKYNNFQDMVSTEKTPMLSALLVTAISLLHVLRETSFCIVAPLSRKLPLVGPYLYPLFQRLGPSDVREREEDNL